MADLKIMLNPVSEKKHIVSMPSTPTSSPTMSDVASPRKKLKLAKDVPIFTPGPTRGECRFPPDEWQDNELAKHHERLEVTPFGEIATYPRHIPYNSEKKEFQQKTGRDFLEVFQYTFKHPETGIEWTMLWDYNIGLVRTTPLFKCLSKSKTTPAKMLKQNPGLKEISHSITGGAIVAQGYWIPHAAAKALAATFCWEIRHALTPVFGHDFPDLCLKPHDIEADNWTIDPSIVRYCAQQAKQFRDEELSTPAPMLRPLTPSTPSPRQARPGQSKRKKPIEQIYSSPYDSPYTSDTGSDDNYRSAASTPEPTPHYRKFFTPVNTPREPPRSVPYQDRRLPSPREILAQSSMKYSTMHQEPITPITPGIPSMRCLSPSVSPKTIPSCMRQTPVRGHDAVALGSDADYSAYDMEWLDKRIPEEQQRAAFALLSLKFGKCDEGDVRGLGITLPTIDEKRAASA